MSDISRIPMYAPGPLSNSRTDALSRDVAAKPDAAEKDTDMSALRGANSDVDLKGTLAKLIDLEKRPIAVQQRRIEALKEKQEAFQAIRKGLGELGQFANAMNERKVQGALTDPGVVDVGVNAKALLGNHEIEVTKLAQAQRLVVKGVASTTGAIGSTDAVIKIQFGTAATGSFTPDSDVKELEIRLPAGEVTLEGVRAAIQAANRGINAQILDNGSGTDPHQLVLTSATGERSSMKIAVSGNADLEALIAYDPATPSASVTQSQAAQDAELTFNGVAMKKSSNSFDAADGISLELRKVGKTSLTIGRDNGETVKALAELLTQINTVSAAIQENSAYDVSDKEKPKAGLFFGEFTASTTQRRLQQTVYQHMVEVGGSSISLKDLGFGLGEDGALKVVDDKKFQTALNSHPEQIEAFFLGASGLSGKLSALVAELNDDEGPLAQRQAALAREFGTLNETLQTLTAKAERAEGALKFQFINLEKMLLEFDRTRTYMDRQFKIMYADK